MGDFSYPVRCLRCRLLAADDLPDHGHHANLGSLHREAFLRGIEDLAHLDGDQVLLLLCLAFSSGAAATVISETLKRGKLINNDYLGVLIVLFMKPPPCVLSLHMLDC